MPNKIPATPRFHAEAFALAKARERRDAHATCPAVGQAKVPRMQRAAEVMADAAQRIAPGAQRAAEERRLEDLELVFKVGVAASDDAQQALVARLLSRPLDYPRLMSLVPEAATRDAASELPAARLLMDANIRDVVRDVLTEGNPLVEVLPPQKRTMVLLHAAQSQIIIADHFARDAVASPLRLITAREQLAVAQGVLNRLSTEKRIAGKDDERNRRIDDVNDRLRSAFFRSVDRVLDTTAAAIADDKPLRDPPVQFTGLNSPRVHDRLTMEQHRRAAALTVRMLANNFVSHDDRFAAMIRESIQDGAFEHVKRMLEAFRPADLQLVESGRDYLDEAQVAQVTAAFMARNAARAQLEASLARGKFLEDVTPAGSA